MKKTLLMLVMGSAAFAQTANPPTLAQTLGQLQLDITAANAAFAISPIVQPNDLALLTWLKNPANGELLLFAQAQVDANVPPTSSYSFGVGSTLACSSSAPIVVVPASSPAQVVKP